MTVGIQLLGRSSAFRWSIVLCVVMTASVCADSVQPSGAVVIVDSRIKGSAQIVNTLVDAKLTTRARVVDVAAGELSQSLNRQLSSIGQTSEVIVLTHGAPGRLLIGGEKIGQVRTVSLPSIGLMLDKVLQPHGAVYFLSCDLAATDEARAQLRALKHQYAYDVFASTDVTGDKATGGNWYLEFGTSERDTTHLSSLLKDSGFRGTFSAPDDIGGNNIWLDGHDVDGDEDYFDNPANGANVTTWSDKGPNGFVAGEALTFNAGQRAFPTYSTGNGVSFDGSGDVLQVGGGIFSNGVVTSIDMYVVATTLSAKDSFLFHSGRPARSTARISAHIPWRNSRIYWDHPVNGGGRLSDTWANTGSTYNTRYIWDFRTIPGTGQRVVRDGNTIISDGTTSTYTEGANHDFNIGSGENNASYSHDGVISELLVYARVLNVPEQHILNNYLSSKWNVTLAGAFDHYLGDTAANGDYDFLVGGVGRDAAASLTTGTSAGLTIQDGGFLTDNGDYLLAGVDSLAPATGMTSSDTPASVNQRSNRVWFFDKTDVSANAGQISLEFDLAEMGVPTSGSYNLLYRSASSGLFSIVGSQSTASGGSVQFNLDASLIADGYYAIGDTASVTDLEIFKSVSTPTPVVGSTVTFTLTITNNGPDTATDVTASDIVPAGFSYVAGSIAGGDSRDDSSPSSGSGLTWTINSLPPGATSTVTVTFDATVNSP